MSRSKVNREIWAAFAANDFNPVTEAMAQYDLLPDGNDKFKAAMEMVAYVHPKLRSVEHKIPSTHKMVFTLGGTDV